MSYAKTIYKNKCPCGIEFSCHHKNQRFCSISCGCIYGNSGYQKGHTFHVGRKRSELTKLKITLSRIGEKNPAWKGDEINYHSMHLWLNKNFPKTKICATCKRIDAPMYDLALKNGYKYQRRIENFTILCRSCHMKYDYANGTRKGGMTGKVPWNKGLKYKHNELPHPASR